MYRYLLLVFGLLSFNSLFAADNYQHDTKCGTFWNTDMRNKLMSQNRVLYSEDRQNMHKAVPSPSGMFLIHYDTLGINAVDMTDKNNNKLPDYIDSVAYYFDYAWAMEVDSMKFKAPLPDYWRGGSGAYDIYIQECGNGTYTAYGLTVRDSNFTKGSVIQWNTYIIIDNNYSPYDYTIDDNDNKHATYKSSWGYDALKVTAVHEFHHAIQLSYGEPIDANPAFNEMTSVAMELLLFPEIPDFLGYTQVLMKTPWEYPFGNHTYSSGYKWGLFFYYLTKTHDINLLINTWDLISRGKRTYTALDSSLHLYGSDIDNEWKKFTSYLFFSGPRLAEWNFLPFASQYPEFTCANQLVLSGDEKSISGFVYSFELKGIEVVATNANPMFTGDTATVFLTCSNLFRAENPYDYSPVAYTLDVSKTAKDGYKKVPGAELYYDISGTLDSTDNIDTVYYNGGVVVEKLAYAFPNPINMKESSEINIPVPEEANYGQTILMDIFTSDFYPVYSEKLKVVYENNRKVVKFIPKDYLNKSGVYIFKTKYFDNEVMGKFALVE